MTSPVVTGSPTNFLPGDLAGELLYVKHRTTGDVTMDFVMPRPSGSAMGLIPAFAFNKQVEQCSSFFQLQTRHDPGASVSHLLFLKD